ncbi:MAG TPA: amino acid ABC transporter substrate-binding protein [Acetobacteraceae bacterium]|jgi:branched-chain amino acid transport system substrate-binding protein|nr:amino acid ABC transporter substrate-binding protein [Acetobacteraceae bacterium]
MRPSVAGHLTRQLSRTLLLAIAFAIALGVPRRPVTAAEPITIGFAEALTGNLAVVGKSGLLAQQLWAEDVNAKGGLLGRQVKLIYYDNQSNPANVPGIYTKLLDVDHVDLVVSPYATNMTAPAMPVAMAHGKLFISVFCLAVNHEFHYPRYFSMLPTGPDPMHAFSQGYFDLAMSETPRPRTIAIVAADAEFSRNASSGARDNAKAAGLRIVYDGTYPPTTADYTPIVRAVRASNPDIVYVASYPADTAGILRAVHEVGLSARLFGGNLVGLQTTALKTQLGPLLDGVVVNENWLPSPALRFPGVMDFLARYQAKAPAEGVDPLGWFLPPWTYARLQVLQQAVTATGNLDDAKLADYIHANSFKTIVGEIAFGNEGEWTAPRIIWTQFRGIQGHDIAQFKDPATEIVLLPTAYKSGDLIYPYESATP